MVEARGRGRSLELVGGSRQRVRKTPSRRATPNKEENRAWLFWAISKAPTVNLMAVHGSGSAGASVGSGEWQWLAGKVAEKC